MLFVRYNSEKEIIMATGCYGGNLDLMGPVVFDRVAAKNMMINVMNNILYYFLQMLLVYKCLKNMKQKQK